MNSNTINEIYGNKIRIRVCGILIKDNALLLLKHRNIGENGYLWIPPGGGVEFLETIKETLIREFKEETTLDIIPDKFLFLNEFIQKPFHAIELFHTVRLIDINQSENLGTDPETPSTPLLIDIKYFSIKELIESPQGTIHEGTLDWAKKNLI